MKLSSQDAELFFKLMWPLQVFVNRKRHLISDVKTVDDYQNRSMKDKLLVRDALYDHPELIEAFIRENPDHLSGDELNIIAQWRHFIRGDFYIERFLKKYAVFIMSNDRVYGVLGLHESLQEIIPPAALPTPVKAVLLPFKDVIVYDGLLQGYNVIIGSGIAGELKESYMAAKQADRIITSLATENGSTSKKKTTRSNRNLEKELSKLLASADRLRGGGGQPAIYSPVFGLVRASLALAQEAVQDPENVDALWQSFEKAHRALAKVETTLHRAGRYH